MDAFKTHEKVISDYKSYLKSFININDKRISEFVNHSTLVNNILPEPLIQFNPSFEKGESLEELVQENTIHPNLLKTLGKYRLYKHQVEATQIGSQDKGFVVTSGTGSGKSLTFLATVFNDLINERLEPYTLAKQVNPFQLANAIRNGINLGETEENFIRNDLANWLEMNIALQYNHDVLERGKPLSIDQIAKKIHNETSLSKDEIRSTLSDLLKWAERINENNRLKGTRKSFLPFRFHQFISQTGSISVTLEPRNTRYITSSDEPFVKIDGKEKKLYPLLFSRYSDYEFLCVELNIHESQLLPVIPNKEFVNNVSST